MRAITAGELTQLRGDNQYAELYSIPRVPNVIYSARLASVPASHDMVAEISINNGTGTAANIKTDMKVLVGTSAGGDELGFCRVRAVPSLVGGAGTLAVGLLSHIDWQANCYLTITDDYDIFPRHSYWIAGEQFVDYGVEYQDQHETFEPIVNMGGHRVIVLSSGTASHQRTDASEVFDGTVSSRLWAAPNAASVTNSTSATATFNYTTAGHFCEYLTITTNDGKTFTGVRYVFVLNGYPSTSNLLSFRLNETASDGVEFDFEMAQNAALSDFKHRAFVIVFARTYYQNVEDYISYKTGEANIIGCGRISSERVRWNDETGTVTFTAANWKYWLGKVSAFPFTLTQATNTPATWGEMNSLNIDRAVWALLHEYSTMSRIADFYPSDDTRYARELAAANNNLASQLEEISLARIYADLAFDRYGSGHLRVEPQLVPEADRSGWAVVQTITSEDYETELSAELNPHEEESQMSLSAVSVERFGTEQPHFALSYGRMYAPYGTPGTDGDLIVDDQEHANQIAGLMMGWNNRIFDSLTVRFVGMNMMYSAAEYCRAYIAIAAGDNPRGVAYTGYLNVRSITYEWDADSNFISSVVEFQDESVEQLSVTGDFPDDAEMDDDFSTEPLPSFTFPDLPPIAIIPPSVENNNHPKEVITATSKGVFYAKDFDAANPTFTAMNNGLNAADIASYWDDVSTYLQIQVTPSGSLWLFESIASNGTSPKMRLYYASGLGGVWTKVYDNEVVGSLYVTGMGVNPEANEQVGLLVYDPIAVTSRFYIGDTSGFTQGSDTFASRKFHSGVVFQGSNIYAFHSSPAPFVHKATLSGSVVASANIQFSVLQQSQARFALGLPSGFFQWDISAFGGYNKIADALVATRYTGITPKDNPQAVAFSPDGQYALGASGALSTPYISTDAGETWSSLGGTIPVGSDIWESCKDSNRWLFGGGIILRLTLDRGLTYVEKAGNLSFVAGALYDVRAIRFIS